MNSLLTNIARKGARGVARRLSYWGDNLGSRSTAALTGILSSSVPFVTKRAEAAFDRIQASRAARSEYGYDPLSTWKRAISRSQTLVSLRTGRLLQSAAI
jgi:hypothetical protein